MSSWSFITADDEELNDALEGRAVRGGYPWPSRLLRRPVDGREVGVLSEDTECPGQSRPVALVVSDDMSRRLFGRYAQLRSDLSPLSAWCHVIDWDQFEQLLAVTQDAELAGFEASWIGLTVAETLILSDRALPNIKLAACLATQSYVLARCRALWPSEKAERILARYDQCQKLLRATDRSANRLREAFSDIWRTLLAVSSPLPRDASGNIRTLVKAVMALRSARLNGADEADALCEVLSDLPESDLLRRLEGTTPEGRVRDFDRLIASLDALPEQERGKRSELQFLAGYIATIAAGGASSLGLAEQLSARWPQIAGWAYVIGGVGERVTWTSGFDGLGRLVARELLRPLRLNDPPMCDFALEEAAVVVDRALQDPLVHLRVKQSRIMSVALYPGVNVSVPIAEAPQDARPREIPQRADARSSQPLAALADALWPYFESRFRSISSSATDTPRRSGKSRGVRRQEWLPLADDRDR